MKIQDWVYLITYFLTVVYTARFYRGFASCKFSKQSEFIYYGLFYSCSVINYLFAGAPILNTCISIIGLFLLASMYENDFRKKVMMVVQFFLFTAVSEIMAVVICGLVIPESFMEKMEVTTSMSYVCLSLGVCICVHIFRRFQGMRANAGEPIIGWGSVLLVQVILLSFIALLATQMEGNGLIVAMVIISVINYIITSIYDKLLLSESEKREKMLIVERGEAYQRETEVLVDSYMKIRGIYHDLKNHILVMESFVRQKNYQELQEYLKNLQGETQTVGFYAYTGHPTIDSILNYKESVAQKYDTELILDSQIPSQLSIDNYEFSVLFGNLLDNAIEACMAVTGKKTIRVVMKVAKNQLHLYMENPYVGNLQWENGLPLSKKENRELHGIGTQNVKRIVEKYNGAMDIETEDNVFRIKILLYLG